MGRNTGGISWNAGSANAADEMMRRAAEEAARKAAEEAARKAAEEAARKAAEEAARKAAAEAAAAEQARVLAEQATAAAQTAAAQALAAQGTETTPPKPQAEQDALNIAASEATAHAQEAIVALTKAEQAANAATRELNLVTGVDNRLPYPLAENQPPPKLPTGQPPELPPEEAAALARWMSVALAEKRAQHLLDAEPSDISFFNLKPDESVGDTLQAAMNSLVGRGDPVAITAFFDRNRAGIDALERILRPEAPPNGAVDTSTEATYRMALAALQAEHPEAKLELVVGEPPDMTGQVDPSGPTSVPVLIRMTLPAEEEGGQLRISTFQLDTYGLHSDPTYAAMSDVASQNPELSAEWETKSAEWLDSGNFGTAAMALYTMSPDSQVALLRGLSSDEGSLFGGLLTQVDTKDEQQVIRVNAGATAQGLSADTSDAFVDVSSISGLKKDFNTYDANAKKLFASTFLEYGMQPEPPLTLPLGTSDIENFIGTAIKLPPNTGEAGAQPGAALYAGDSLAVVQPVAESIKKIAQDAGLDGASITALPVMLNTESEGQVQMMLYKVGTPDGDRFVDNLGRTYTPSRTGKPTTSYRLAG